MREDPAGRYWTVLYMREVHGQSVPDMGQMAYTQFDRAKDAADRHNIAHPDLVPAAVIELTHGEVREQGLPILYSDDRIISHV